MWNGEQGQSESTRIPGRGREKDSVTSPGDQGVEWEAQRGHITGAPVYSQILNVRISHLLKFIWTPNQSWWGFCGRVWTSTHISGWSPARLHPAFSTQLSHSRRGLKMPKRSAEELSRVLKFRQPGMCLVGKYCVIFTEKCSIFLPWGLLTSSSTKSTFVLLC